MIMSGLYEASLDRKIITNILADLKKERKQREKAEEEGADPEPEIDRDLQRTLFYKRIHQLYAVLVGNLKLPPTTEDVPKNPRTVWKDVNNLVKAPEAPDVGARAYESRIIQECGTEICRATELKAR
jgi:hypothetical protein